MAVIINPLSRHRRARLNAAPATRGERCKGIEIQGQAAFTPRISLEHRQWRRRSNRFEQRRTQLRVIIAFLECNRSQRTSLILVETNTAMKITDPPHIRQQPRALNARGDFGDAVNETGGRDLGRGLIRGFELRKDRGLDDRDRCRRRDQMQHCLNAAVCPGGGQQSDEGERRGRRLRVTAGIASMQQRQNRKWGVQQQGQRRRESCGTRSIRAAPARIVRVLESVGVVPGSAGVADVGVQSASWVRLVVPHDTPGNRPPPG